MMALDSVVLLWLLLILYFKDNMDKFYRLEGRRNRSYKIVVFSAVLLLVVGGLCYYYSEDHAHTQFKEFVVQYNKQYSESEYTYRLSVYRNNLNMINFINSAQTSVILEINEFGDLTQEEFQTSYLSTFPRVGMYESTYLPTDDLPNAIDWRDQNAVTQVKNQKSCGSCWAFSAIGAIESAWAISHNELVVLSEQQLVDCSDKYGNLGCDGGFMVNAFEYVKDQGVSFSADYEYEGYRTECREGRYSKPVHISGYETVPKNNSLQLQAAVARQPISVGVDANNIVFMFYKSGTIDAGACGNNLSHGVLVVGYGEDWNGLYWIVKNSWGRRWGQLGYAKIRRTVDQNSEGMCGIAIDASYPKI